MKREIHYFCVIYILQLSVLVLSEYFVWKYMKHRFVHTENKKYENLIDLLHIGSVRELGLL